MRILNINQFISERMKIVPISNDELDKVKVITYNYYPKTKDELLSIIGKRIEKEGTECDLNDIDTSKIIDMSELFMGLHEFNGNISGWDTSKVTDMNCMFYEAKSFNQDISKWDTSKVTNMECLFCGAESFNQDISRWDTSKVINMRGMFYGAKSFNQDISKWSISKVTDMDYMFDDCPIENQIEKQPVFYK